VTKRYGDRAVVDDVSFVVPSGLLTAILGPSGSGKSTLLKMISGLERPDAGRVVIEGDDVTDVDPRHRDIGFCFQNYAPFRHMTVARNVGFGLTARRRPRREVRQRVGDLLELVRLSDKADRYPAQLSGGERQRMALARALAIEPRVLLLDEPFAALDATVRAELRRWVRELHEETHITTILVTHDQDEAMEVADRLVVINEGRVEQVGTPTEVYDEPASEFVHRFLGPSTQFEGRYLRPHELLIGDEDGWGATGVVWSIASLGFEARVLVELDSGEMTLVQMSRPDLLDSGIAVGERVSVRRRGAAIVAEVV
jgi:sulfate transport system ATP-binding protein